MVGLQVDTSGLQKYILPVTILMIYPTMIGFTLGEVLRPNNKRLLFSSLAINFIFIPLLAYVLGSLFLRHHPGLFAGLAVASLLPTSNMTIAFTMFAGANVAAAIQLTVVGLITGSLLAPWYLLVMVGKYIPVDVLTVLKTLTMVVILPLIMGTLTYRLLLRKYTPEEFQAKFKPYLPAATAWGAIYIIFTSISTNAHRIVDNIEMIILVALLVQLLFYAINYLGVIQFSRYFFNRRDGITLVYGTALRNLSISIGLAATAFGADAALMVSLAFLIQGQAAAWYLRFIQRKAVIGEYCQSGREIEGRLKAR
ncbi:arsenic resistance protein [Desulforamulus ferrireducens]|uniref:arsenic resistance protein n=1 Tax=Desulforamulus ferrireducens TaxID=1833852 RepID=UPI001EE4A987|nr:bile acid:sodium symporter [Desulforamulus ferrireducens]